LREGIRKGTTEDALFN